MILKDGHLFTHEHNDTRMMNIRLIIIAMICLLILSCKSVRTEGSHENAVSADSPDSASEEKTIGNKFKFENDAVSPSTNIHYTGKYCNECHEKIPVEGVGSPNLKFGGDYKELCRCHAVSPADYIHPVDIKPSSEKAKRIPAGFPLENGKLSCITCHNIYLQCRKRLFDRNSLRGAPYPSRTDFCYQCHAKENYGKLDPHRQINDKGEIIIDRCLVCHLEKPDEKHATFKEVKFIGDIEVMCRRCHHIAGNHSGNADHMGIKPSADGLKRMAAMEKKYNTRLPLDENGKMTCITCHNPHEKGVIPDDRPGAKGAGSKYRHRLDENMCKECHQM